MANDKADMFTKNLAGPEHNKHAARLCGKDKYDNTAQDGELQNAHDWKRAIEAGVKPR